MVSGYLRAVIIMNGFEKLKLAGMYVEERINVLSFIHTVYFGSVNLCLVVKG